MERPTFARQASDLPADSIAHSPTHSSDLNSDEKTGAESYDEKKGLDGEHFHPASLRSVRSEDIIDGHERPIETAEDLTQRCISLEDDPELPVHTLRMWVLGKPHSIFLGSRDFAHSLQAFLLRSSPECSGRFSTSVL